jgi:hypothetical protein
VKDVRSFLRLSGYYHQYILRYAEKSRPLTQLTKKNLKFHWTEDQERAFQQLKEEISSDTVLAYPGMDPEHEYRLHTDASDIGISAVLSQVQGGVRDRLASQAAAEKNPSVMEKELLAAIFGSKQFRCYLYGRKFTLVTGHRALCWLLKLEEPSAKLTRWALRLSEFQYTVEHRPGKQHLVPDALSRNTATVRVHPSLDRAAVKVEQETDEFCKRIKADLTKLPGYFVDDDNLLYLKNPEGTPRLVVLGTPVLHLIRENHDARYAAHAGIRKTQEWMRKLPLA